jgi:hypothetical protein
MTGVRLIRHLSTQVSAVRDRPSQPVHVFGVSLAMIRMLFSLSLAVAFAVPVLADDPAAPKKDAAAAQAPKKDGDKPAQPKKEGAPKKEGEAKKPKKQADPNKGPQLRGAIKPIESKVELTADQKAKVEALVAELQPKYRETFKGLKFTEEQQAARKAAQEKAKADGLKGEAATKAVHEAMKLTAEQKAAMEQQTAVANEFREKVKALLTPEQKASLKKKPEAKKS